MPPLTNLTSSATGTVADPGANVRANAGLNRSLLEQNLGHLTTQLTYQAAWAGRMLVKVPVSLSTRTFSRRLTVGEGPASDRTFRCLTCGFAADRDENVALNMLRLTCEALGVDTENAQPTLLGGPPTNAPVSFLRAGNSARHADRNTSGDRVMRTAIVREFPVPERHISRRFKLRYYPREYGIDISNRSSLEMAIAPVLDRHSHVPSDSRTGRLR